MRILERNPTALLHDQGAGVVAGGDVQTFFAKYDATHSPMAVTSKLRHYLDRDGNQIYSEKSVQHMTSWDLLYNILRANFDAVQTGYCNVPELKDGEGSGVYDYGHTVKALGNLEGGRLELHYQDADGNESKQNADLIIGADGSSSTLRGILLPEVRRTYAGYVAWRGTVPESDASEEARAAFVEKFAFYHTSGIQILACTIPGHNGSLKVGKRLINWVWYCNYPQDSKEYAELMTDIEGRKHHSTLPLGKMRPEIWEQQQDYAKHILPPQFAELVTKTKQPFIQAICDVIAPKNVFYEGKVLLTGDAVAGFRPHTAASTNQAAFDAQLLGKLIEGEMTMNEWERETTDYAKHMQRRGIEMGQRSQFGHHPLAI